MTDRDTGDREEAKPFGQELISFVEGLKFGTPEFLAVSDYFQEQRLYRELAIHRGNALKDGDASQIEYWRSEERITEAKIGFMQHRIYQSETQLGGYSKAYHHIKSGLQSDLALASNNEADKKYPNDPTANSVYAKHIYDEVEARLEDQVFLIMEASKPAA